MSCVDYDEKVKWGGLNSIPAEHRTYERCLLAVGRSDYALEDVPKEHLTYEMCMAGVSWSVGPSLRFVPEEFRDYAMCLAAVTYDDDLSSDDELNLKYVPDEILTYELCKIAVKGHSFSIQHVPARFFTAEIYNLAANSSLGLMEDFTEYVKDNVFTPEVCREIVSKYGHGLENIPENFITEEMVRTVMSRGDGHKSFCFVPDKFKTYAMCLEDVKRTGTSLMFVPDKFKTYEMCLTACNSSFSVLEYIPVDVITQAMCQLAIFTCKWVQLNPAKHTVIAHSKEMAWGWNKARLCERSYSVFEATLRDILNNQTPITAVVDTHKNLYHITV